MSKQSGNPHSFKQSGRQSWRKIVLTEVFRILESEGSLQRLPAHRSLDGYRRKPRCRTSARTAQNDQAWADHLDELREAARTRQRQEKHRDAA
jgi:hypothetical protein